MLTRELRRNMKKMKESGAYLRAYEDLQFLHREDLRPVRLQLELLKPELALQAQGITSTVVIFGSTRTVSKEEIEPTVTKLEKRVQKRPNDAGLRKELAVAKRLLAKSSFYDEARLFARIVSSACQMEGRCDFVVVTGGGPGIMEAANRGAYDVGAKTVGLNITLPHEQYPNPYITPELCFQFHYFALRKMHFMMRAKAMVIFPGGYGTLDELFEALTLVQTGKVSSLPIILFGKKWWSKLINFNFLRDEGVIAPQDLDLFRFAETAEEAWEKIQEYYRSKNAGGGPTPSGSPTRPSPGRGGGGARGRS
ncbi:MAG TPA: TIGR00730 family Rossman fold protein [Candidatus Polarisedimenticolia bacterium]|nr:TIGR00730 family Rossman fold protein [Candidatus Polarisedimenticolia bacterium]